MDQIRASSVDYRAKDFGTDVVVFQEEEERVNVDATHSTDYDGVNAGF